MPTLLKRICLYFLFLSPLLMTTGCMKHHLHLQTDYLSRENLASYHVGTPDPLLYCPPIGQRLIMSWSVPREWLREEELKVALHLIYRNHTQEYKEIFLIKSHGLYLFTLINEDYFEKGGILTYKAELIKGDQILDEWCHQLWTDLILIDPPPPEEETDDDNEDDDEVEKPNVESRAVYSVVIPHLFH